MTVVLLAEKDVSAIRTLDLKQLLGDRGKRAEGTVRSLSVWLRFISRKFSLSYIFIW